MNSFISDLADFIRVTGEHLDHEKTDIGRKDSRVPDTVPDVTKSENGFLRLYARCVAVWVCGFQGPAGDTSVWVRSADPDHTVFLLTLARWPMASEH